MHVLTVLGILNSEVNMRKTHAIKVQKANTKSSAGQHGPPKNSKAGSDAKEEMGYSSVSSPRAPVSR
jgi:hypothetical protein